MNMLRLLIATVGGATEPIIASLLHWRPARAVFIVTPQTRDAVVRDILPKVCDAGWPDFDAGRYDLHEISDHQDYSGIVNQLRPLDDRVAAWQRDRSGAEVIADLTGGTKAMSAALALAAGRWPCRISYVGGNERTKDGVGIVVSGKEQILHAQNPADALGLLALDTSIELLRTHAFAAAHTTLQQALGRVTDPARKAELSAVANLAEALADWDRFQHEKALNKLRDLGKKTHNLEAALGCSRAQVILVASAKIQTHLQAILAAGSHQPSRALILDLLANARRRLDEHRWDDATARLYRTIEATAQFHLTNAGVSDTARVPLEKIPEPLCSKVALHAKNGFVKLGLQEAWILLKALSAVDAHPFFAAGLDAKENPNESKSPLIARNLSILAHGFVPVRDAVANRLFTDALSLVPAHEADLPSVPIFNLNH
jgi:CRISPR-associated protein (TIGR02710 family)